MTETPKPKYRVGVLGCGRKGTEHARAYALSPMTEVVAAADPDPENLDLFCSRFGLTVGYDSYQQLLDNEKIDIVSAVLPVSVNPEVVLGCARADVRAICSEKPISASLADADRMVEECRSRGIKLACGDLERNLPDYWKAREIIESGELGEVQTINILSGSGTQMSGGGCQNFSLMRMFAGDADVAWVIGWVADDPMSDYDQGVAGYVRFVNGVECFMTRTPNARFGIEVLCSRGVFYSDGQYLHLWKTEGAPDRPTSATLRKVEGVFPETPLHQGFGTYDEEGWERPGPRQEATVQSVIDSLEDDIEPRGSGDNGRKVLELAIALRESHRRNHTPVRLPLEDRSLRIIPVPGRWLNKKEVYGREWYAKEIGRYTRTPGASALCSTATLAWRRRATTCSNAVRMSGTVFSRLRNCSRSRASSMVEARVRMVAMRGTSSSKAISPK